MRRSEDELERERVAALAQITSPDRMWNAVVVTAPREYLPVIEIWLDSWQESGVRVPEEVGIRRDSTTIEIWARRQDMIASHRITDIDDKFFDSETGRPWAGIMSSAIISLDDALRCRKGYAPSSVVKRS